jgi:hypothetical protein
MRRHGNYRRRFGSKWLWFILKLHFGIIMEGMRKTNAHFNQKGSCPVETRFGFLLNNIRWQTVMDRQRRQLMTDAGYLTAGIYSEFNRRSVCKSKVKCRPILPRFSTKNGANHTVRFFLRQFKVIQEGKNLSCCYRIYQCVPTFWDRNLTSPTQSNPHIHADRISSIITARFGLRLD